MIKQHTNRHSLFKRLPTSIQRITLLVLLLISSGCATITPLDHLTPTQTTDKELSQRHFHVDIESFDGVKVRATVFQPALNAGETAPAIIHTHGFGVWRMRAPNSLYGSLLLSGKTARAAWEELGYWVISVDHRGFGGSEGETHLMDPSVEIQDVSAVVDWIANNLRVTLDAENDPRIGMIGESFGGAAQLMASTVDDRIDAIVPLTTWYDLSEALAPQGHLKTFWTSILVGTSTITSGFDTGIFARSEFLKSAAGDMTSETELQLYQNSMAYFCDRGQAPQAATLLIQGFRDTVFPVNHAWDNRNCILEHQPNADVTLMLVQGGHLLPTQRLLGMPLYHVEEQVHCEDKAFNIEQTIVHWLDSRLSPSEENLARIQDLPELCISQDDNSGVVTQHLHHGGEWFEVPPSDVYAGLAGIGEIIMRPIDWLTQWAYPKEHPTNLEEIPTTGGKLRPAFVPLMVANKSGYLFGMPAGELRLTGKKEGSIVFAGIGIQSAPGKPIKLISEQVEPLKGIGNHYVEFSGVSSNLQTGDVVGLVLYGTHSQYFLNRNFIPNRSIVSGRLALPLFRKHANQYVAYSSIEPQQYPLPADENEMQFIASGLSEERSIQENDGEVGAEEN